MELIEHTDERGRTYKAFQDGDKFLIIGPPEDLIDGLKLPEDVGTRLHNELYRRGIFTYTEARKKSSQILGALQSVLNVDVQIIMQAFYEGQK